MKQGKSFLPAFFISAALILFLGALFFFRAPVLVVSDIHFNNLYGTKRILYGRVKASLSLFRPVREVILADGIGDDGIAFAVSEVSEKPYYVGFPHRYASGARRYKQQFPDIPVILFSGREGDTGQNQDITLVPTDLRTDFYRAGLGAAVLSGGGPGKILCYADDRIGTSAKHFLQLGLSEGGVESSPIFINTNDKYVSNEQVSCIILAGNTEDPFISRQNIPIILFSWADPALLPASVRIIFNDSPWEMIVPAVKTLQKGEFEGEIPSAAGINNGNGLTDSGKKQLKAALSKNKPLLN